MQQAAAFLNNRKAVYHREILDGVGKNG